MNAAPEVDAAAELSDLVPGRLAALGFRPEDAAAVLDLVDCVTAEELDRVQHFADRLLPRVGRVPAGGGDAVWQGLDDSGSGSGSGSGRVPLLALLVTAPAVVRWRSTRGITEADSWAALADLGQQVAVHRLVHGTFGLETYGWLAGHVWTGSFLWAGRLQLDLERVAAVDGRGEDWVLGTHVPRTGPLTPAAVDASLAAARRFFAEHFADAGATDVYCRSWLLDPRLPVLLPGTNLARFAERWETYGEPEPGDADVAYFAFARRGPVEPGSLGATTSLQRAALSVWEAGGQWHVVEGRLVS